MPITLDDFFLTIEDSKIFTSATSGQISSPYHKDEFEMGKFLFRFAN